MSEDADGIARLADLGERLRVALAWTLEDAGSLPSLRIMAASRLLTLGEEGAALGQLEAIASDGLPQEGEGAAADAADVSRKLARSVLEQELRWHDDTLADRRKELLGCL